MITLINQNNVEYRQHFWRGLASDGLPMRPDFNTKNGDIYQEMDTGRLYMFSETDSDWVEIYLGEEGEIVTVSGVSPISLPDALIREIKKVVQYGKIEQDGTPTTANPVDIVCNNGALKWDSENQRIYADGTPEVITVSADGVADQTASVENLLAYEDLRDEQDIISGKVTRRTEAFMYDGSQTVGSRYISTTGGKDTGAIIVQPLGNEYEGDVVTFEAEDGEPIDSLSVTLTPKQDLHGYANPWPAGGGKNKLPTINQTQTINGVTWTLNSDGSIKLNGTATANSVYDFGRDALTLPAGNYTTYEQSVSSYLITVFEVVNGSASVLKSGGGAFSLAESTSIFVRYFVPNGTTINETIHPQIESGSTATSFAPYENICPITGTESCDVVRTGINLWDEEWEEGGISITNGQDVSVVNAIRSTNYCDCLPNTSYYAVGSYTYKYVFWYDSNKNFLSYNASASLVTSPANARYFRLRIDAYGTTYHNDVSLNYPSTDTAYHAFDPLSTTLSVEWGAVGKNLFDIAERVLNQTKANGDATDGYTLNNGVLSISKDVVNYGRIMLSAMQMKAGTYTLSFAWTASGSGRMSYSIRNMGVDPKVDIVGSTGTTTASVSKTFTLDTDANVAISIQPEGSATGTLSITNIMLNTGSSALPFEPYTKTIYGGHVDAVRGEVVATMKSVDLGSLDWTYSQARVWFYNYSLSIKPSTVNAISSMYARKNTADVVGDLTLDNVFTVNGTSVCIRNLAYTDATAFKSAMQGVQLVYELSTPIRIPLSPQTLTALRNNTVWADAGSVDVFVGSELVEYVEAQILRTAKGDNTISVTAEVDDISLDVEYIKSESE